MPTRNEPCPCGSGTKYKRCCLPRLDAVARELRERDAFLDGLIAWLKTEHAATIEEAGGHTTLMRLLRGAIGRGMSAAWAFNDYQPEDGGPVLIERYAARRELDESDRAIACGLAEARVDAYRVRSVTPGVWLELESLSDEMSVRVAWHGEFDRLQHGDILVLRVVGATSLPTVWGPGVHFPAGTERRWRARLATQPANRAEAALALLEFHPDDVAEPLPDGVELHALTWSIEDEEAVLEELEADDAWESLGQAMPAGWAFAWPEDAESGRSDLGGWQEEPGAIETARLIVFEQHMTLLSADRPVLRDAASHVEVVLGELIAPCGASLAA